jgi:hypothetical protein
VDSIFRVEELAKQETGDKQVASRASIVTNIQGVKITRFSTQL